MGLTRITTRKPTKGPVAVTIEVDGKQVDISYADKLTRFNSEADFKAEIERVVGTKIPIFVHFNRDGGVAIATGRAPEIWPEDASVDD